MVNQLVSWWLRRIGGQPCFEVHGKSKLESNWRIIRVFATHRRNDDSRWPLWRGTCITWSSDVVVVGWDFALRVLREQSEEPASRDRPVEVAGGRLSDWSRRLAAGASSQCSASEVLAHEIGHTFQTLWLGDVYLPVVGAVTLFREGAHWWNYFENNASETGQFGGIVNGSVCHPLMERLGESPDGSMETA
jgi:hypothetical protein